MTEKQQQRKRYQSLARLVYAKQRARFSAKLRDNWNGWDSTGYRDSMAARALGKLAKLAHGDSSDPLKDAADVCNFAIFFYGLLCKDGAP